MSKSNFKGRQVAIYGLFIALVYVATRFINIPGPTAGGLFHLGNVMAFTIAIVFGKKAGAISGGLGMALFDLTSPYAIWAPFTLVIRVAMGYVIGYMANKEKENNVKSFIYTVLGIVVASVIMIGGYYVTEAILYGNWLLPVESIMGNVMQCVIGSVIAVPVSVALQLGFKSRKISTEI